MPSYEEFLKVFLPHCQSAKKADRYTAGQTFWQPEPQPDNQVNHTRHTSSPDIYIINDFNEWYNK